MFRKIRTVTVLCSITAAASLAVSLGTAAPAGATIRFCSATVCIGSGNGCSVRTSTGVVIEADDGDSFIDIHGRKWTCAHGKWVVTLTAVGSSVIAAASESAGNLSAA